MSNLSKALTTRYPTSIQVIRNSVFLLKRFSDIEIEVLWKSFSSDWGGSFLEIDKKTLDRFKIWLEE